MGLGVEHTLHAGPRSLFWSQVPKRPRDFNIEVMVRDPDWLGDEDISVHQMAVLKAIYGLPLTKEELEAFLELTEGRKPRKGGYFEVTACGGVRSGKGDKLGGNVMTYQAITFDGQAAGLAPGEIPYLGIIAQNTEGAAQNFAYLEGKALLLEDKGVDILDHGKSQERAVTGLQIRYRSGVVAQIFPAKKASVRNKTMIGLLCDEIAWWETEAVKVNADVEICRAGRQRMTTTRAFSKFIKQGSPFMEHGVLFNDYEERDRSERLFLRFPSWVFNPTLLTNPDERKHLRETEFEDPSGFRRDYGAQFDKAGGAGFYTSDEIDGAMRDDRPMVIQPQEGRDYHAWIDVAFTKDLFALAVAHREGDEIVYDLVYWWKPEKNQPLDDKVVAEELAGMVKPYRIDRLGGDHVAHVPFQNDISKHDLRLDVQKMTTEENNSMHRNFKACMRRRLVNLPKDPMIRADVLSCVKNGKGNTYRIEAPNLKGFHDDITKVCAAVALELTPIGSVDMEALNAGSMSERDRLFKEHGMPLPEDPDRLPNDIMAQVY